jgi:RNA polymerase sigma factor (sigma-70 family)
MDLKVYRGLRNEARRHARRAEDAEDVLQEALLAALEAGRDVSQDQDRAWLVGTLRNQAAMQARGAVRRRRRESSSVEQHLESAVDTLHAASASHDTAQANASCFAEAAPSRTNSARLVLGRLPPAARRVAVLALHGLNADEIRWILGLSATAFRQRLTSIRKSLATLPPSLRAEALALAYVRDPVRSTDLQFGLIRRALKAALRGHAGIGTHDADGHLIVVRAVVHERAHTLAPRGNE